MPCSTCKLQFNLFKRKRNCHSCNHSYCANCLGRKKNLCVRCEIILSALSEDKQKDKLLCLKTKDLIFFLQSRKINISGIVEKEELCNLIINHISSGSFCESAGNSTSPDFENYSPNFDQIKQTCQNFFTSITDKIALDLQKTTCFHQNTPHQGKHNVTTQQPKPAVSSTFQNPSTSGTTSRMVNRNEFAQTSNKHNLIDCECCSEDELAEISEKRQSILNSDISNLSYNAKKVKLENSSSDSSFEEVVPSKSNTQIDDDWQFVEDDKTKSTIEGKRCQYEASDKVLNSNVNKCPRRKSDSSLLNLRKALDVDTLSLYNDRLVKIKISCKKCGKSKSKMKEELLKLNEQLNSSNLSEDEISAKIRQFIDYLDTKLESNETDNSTNSPSTSYRNENYTNINDENLEAEDDKINQASCSFDPSKRFLSLDDIQSSTDLELLSVKQLKELLALNRVDFKGCCEKKELKERVQRLWESYVNSPASDKLSSNDLCKICMDAPIECVFLECGHTATCTACGKVLSECPICRSYIVRVVRIFKS